MMGAGPSMGASLARQLKEASESSVAACPRESFAPISIPFQANCLGCGGVVTQLVVLRLRQRWLHFLSRLGSLRGSGRSFKSVSYGLRREVKVASTGVT